MTRPAARRSGRAAHPLAQTYSNVFKHHLQNLEKGDVSQFAAGGPASGGASGQARDTPGLDVADSRGVLRLPVGKSYAVQLKKYFGREKPFAHVENFRRRNPAQKSQYTIPIISLPKKKTLCRSGDVNFVQF